MVASQDVGDGHSMAEHRLTAAEHAALVQELETLRARHETELAHRLRDARGFGRSADNDDVLTVFEEAAIEQARIAQLEDLVQRASIVDGDDPGDGVAGLGAVVLVTGDEGRDVEYELVGRRRPDGHAQQVTPASPLGRVLVGARVGDVVRVQPPGGRERVLRVLDVTYEDVADAA
jgi:transcription elongation factor GreA